MNFNFLPHPTRDCFEMLGKNPRAVIREAIMEGKEIDIYVSLKGARNVRTEIRYGKTCLGLNTPIQGFKMHEETKFNPFSHEHVTRHYFKKLKSQGLEEYKAYLKAVLENLEMVWDVKITQPVINVYCSVF